MLQIFSLVTGYLYEYAALLTEESDLTIAWQCYTMVTRKMRWDNLMLGEQMPMCCVKTTGNRLYPQYSVVKSWVRRYHLVSRSDIASSISHPSCLITHVSVADFKCKCCFPIRFIRDEEEDSQNKSNWEVQFSLKYYKKVEQDHLVWPLTKLAAAFS